MIRADPTKVTSEHRLGGGEHDPQQGLVVGVTWPIRGASWRPPRLKQSVCVGTAAAGDAKTQQDQVREGLGEAARGNVGLTQREMGSH